MVFQAKTQAKNVSVELPPRALESELERHFGSASGGDDGGEKVKPRREQRRKKLSQFQDFAGSRLKEEKKVRSSLFRLRSQMHGSNLDFPRRKLIFHHFSLKPLVVREKYEF